MVRLLVLVLSIGVLVAGISDWSYDGPTGPDYWCDLDLVGNQCCGQRQSPINIDTSTAIAQNFQVRTFKFDYQFSYINISNDEHTVTLHFPVDEGIGFPSIIINNNFRPISDQFNLDSMHFHFGSDSSVGSEHQIDGQIFPLEGHTIFYNSKYSSLTEAKLHEDGVIVFGTHYIITQSDNFNYQPLVSAFQNILYVNQVTTLNGPGLSISDLIPNDLSVAYTYEGSLTTPICNEVVQWFVLKLKEPISENQMEMFRTLTILEPPTNGIKPHDGDIYMSDNFRPVQPLNNRPIYT